MKINGNNIRPGNYIEHNGRLLKAVKIQHTQPGKGGAYLQVEFKDVRNGSKISNRFRSDEKVEQVRLNQVPFQFLYADGEELIFMNQDNYEQITLTEDHLNEGERPFLNEGMQVTIELYGEEPVGVELPDQIICTILETEATVKGQTAASSSKPAVLDNGVKVMVPPHIDPGTKVVINTSDKTYVERFKEK